jgi:hypothetical protein
MTLEEFAKEAGCVVSLHPNPDIWGPTYRYHTIDNPNCYFCGYGTKWFAYKGWLEDTFGTTTAKAVLKLLRESEK